jgi:TonB family protein
MNEAVTDIIVARSRVEDRLARMVAWSVAAHIVVVTAVLVFQSTRPEPAPRTIMTISLGGAPGPRTPGLNQMGGRPVQAPPPEQTARRAETAPAPAPPKMTLPDPKSRTRPERARPQQAPPDATGRKETTGAKPQEGTTQAETRNRGQGFGLSTAGGAGDGLKLDVGNFCCPEYIVDMRDRVTRNWRAKQGIVGTTTMKFTIQRDGTITDIQREKSSGFEVLDQQAERALQLTIRFAPLPRQFPNETLTVYMPFDYR